MSRIDEAFDKVSRKEFLPPAIDENWRVDRPLPLGYGQTNSQPTTVRMMLEWLGTKEGEKVLDVGSGSGWTTAMLARIVGSSGKVYGVERIPELVSFGRANCTNFGVSNVSFHRAGTEFGLEKYAPYNRILVSASAKELPTILPEQLKVGGKLVIPVENDILEITKITQSKYKTIIHPGFVFVPLLET